MRAIAHAITPGDHFSPRTGSALPTVIDGLARAATNLEDNRSQAVLVAANTYPERYSSMPVIEYRSRPGSTRLQQAIDLVSGHLTGIRPFQRRTLSAVVSHQRDWKPSFILAHNLVQLIPAVDWSRHRPVLYAHNELLRTYRPREAGRVLDASALIICVSQYLADQTAELLPSSLRGRVVVVPNAADCEQFSPRCVTVTEKLRVAFLGRVVREKGPDVLLQAANLLNDPHLEVTIIGSAGFDSTASLTAYEHELRQLASRVRGSVSFRPFTDRSALPDLLRSQDILVVPSRWPEPWGLTVSEGQASGLVVLATDVGGIPEAISDPEHLIPVGDPHALAAQLQRFAADRELLARHRLQARAHAQTHDWHCSWRILAQHLDNVA